jgi:predicted RND superfamily exporter protein
VKPGPVDHLVVRARWAILALVAVLSAWLIPGTGMLRHDDDVLAFLPPEHPDVVAFREVADRFGMLEVALVGLEPPEGEDLLAPDRVQKVRQLGRRISEVPGVRLMLSFPDFPEAKVESDVLVVQELVPDGMSDAEQIRARVLANPDAVGNFVSPDGRAAAVLAFLSSSGEGDEKLQARADTLAGIEAVVAEGWDGPAYFGGAPFIEHTAASSSRSDIERLSPIVVGVLVVVSALLLRSVTAAILNLLLTGLGVLLVVGAHGRFGEPFTIVSSTMPVMMVALGGAFGMHILAGYQRSPGTPPERAAAVLHELTWPVVLSALTTAVAFFALLVMPQVPMQRFGVVAGVAMLVLLVLALAVLPALLSVLPARLLPVRDNPELPLRYVPPAWVIVLLAVLGAGLGTRLSDEPDTIKVFDADSQPRRAAGFFEEHFGGSQFLQIAIEADLTDPVVLREIRDIGTEVAAVPGVVDVRSLVRPVEIVNEGFGGRLGLPETPERGRRVVTNLADHPAMAQLMTTSSDGAIIHVKLAPQDSDGLSEVTATVRAIAQAHASGPLRVGDPGASEALAEVRRAEVVTRAERIAGRPADAATIASVTGAELPADALLPDATKLRDRVLGTEDVIEPLPVELHARVDPKVLIAKKGDALREYFASALPELVEADPEGPKYLAEFVDARMAELRERTRLSRACSAFGLPAPAAVEDEGEGDGEGEGDPFGDGDAPEGDPAGEPASAKADAEGDPSAAAKPASEPCAPVMAALAELGDARWRIPADLDAPVLEELPWSLRFTGQPVIGEAFGDSVTRSLGVSTLVSWLALAIVLVVFGHARALVPATWTLAVTAGIVAALGHPISVGTSMVSCIALGAGVDFAIHLGVRARESTGPEPGREAAESLGSVVFMAGLQLALAFCVLLASGMPPLRQFGVGLAIGLLVAAAGAVWLTPRLYRRRPGPAERSKTRASGDDLGPDRAAGDENSL